jgi:hypothetical protein
MEDNIKIDIKEIFRQGVDWTDLIRDRDTWRTVVDTAMNRLFLCFDYLLKEDLVGCLVAWFVCLLEVKL